MKIEFIRYQDGSTYEGELEDGQRHGYGLFIRPDGNKFKGEWKEGKPHGKGIIFTTDGRMIEGIWVDGKLLKEESKTKAVDKVDTEHQASEAVAKYIEGKGDTVLLHLNTTARGDPNIIDEGIVLTDKRVIFVKIANASLKDALCNQFENVIEVLEYVSGAYAICSSFDYRDILNIYMRVGVIGGGHIHLLVNAFPDLRGISYITTISENALNFHSIYKNRMNKVVELIQEKIVQTSVDSEITDASGRIVDKNHLTEVFDKAVSLTDEDIILDVDTEYKSGNKVAIIEKPKEKKYIRETKSTCKSCGKSWYYNKSDVLNFKSAEGTELGKSLMCCSGCLPALFIPTQNIPDPTKCPECNSENVTREEVTHEV